MNSVDGWVLEKHVDGLRVLKPYHVTLLSSPHYRPSPYYFRLGVFDTQAKAFDALVRDREDELGGVVWKTTSGVEILEDFPMINTITSLLMLYNLQGPFICSRVENVPHISGLYFLWSKGEYELRYVGQSTDIRSRLASHHIYKGNESFAIGVVRLENKRLRKCVEIALIGLLNPRANKKRRTSRS